MMIACVGASQGGKAPAKCSMRMPMKRSRLPKGARWIMTGRTAFIVAVDIFQVEALW